MKKFSLAVLFTALIVACVQHTAAPPTAPPKLNCSGSFHQEWGGSSFLCVMDSPMPEACPMINGKKFCTWLPSHVAFVAGRINGDMLSADLGDLCPKISTVAALDSYMAFWQALFKCTAQAESGFDPQLGYTEKFTDGLTKVSAVSVGLMQLSVGDKLNYHTPYCSKLDAITIKDPETNLGCASEIMVKLMNNRKGSLRAKLGGGNGTTYVGYWSTIRDRKIDVCLKTEIPRCF